MHLFVSILTVCFNSNVPASLFLLQALADNAAEEAQAGAAEEAARLAGYAWLAPGWPPPCRAGAGTLHVVDNLAHAYSTAGAVAGAAAALGLLGRLTLHDADALARAPSKPSPPLPLLSSRLFPHP